MKTCPFCNSPEEGYEYRDHNLLSWVCGTNILERSTRCQAISVNIPHILQKPVSFLKKYLHNIKNV